MKSRIRIIGANIAQNAFHKMRYAVGLVGSDIGATHKGMTVEQSVEYINRVFSEYLQYGGLEKADLEGARVLEIGPGDNFGVALRFFASGAQSVVCVDKFLANRNASQQRAIYDALGQSIDEVDRIRYKAALEGENHFLVNSAAVDYIYGVSAHEANRQLAPEQFDLIVSRAVLWEIHEIDATLESLHKLLKPGGICIHKIACLDWMFRQEGYHHLEFLTVPDFWYRLMASDSGKSNRKPARYYLDYFESKGYLAKRHVTAVVGSSKKLLPPGTENLKSGIHFSSANALEIESMRPRLIDPFRRLPIEEIMIEDMFLVARKPLAKQQ